MNTTSKGSPPLLLGGNARNLAAWVVLAGALVCLGLSWWLSWPLGPDYVDEGGITRIRLAIATLVLGQAFMFGFLMFYLRDILVRVKRLTEGRSKPDENQGRSEGSPPSAR